MDPQRTPARRLWEAVEPLHAVVYFAPEPAEAAKALGLPSWWMGYFTGRVAPLGPLDAPPVTAMLFGFAPSMVARSLPDAWAYASPDAVLAARLDAVRATLERALPPGSEGRLERLAELLERAVAGCRYDGRPLAAGWSGVRRPASAAGRVWLAATVLREHRGDGHVLAAVGAGLRGLDATLTLVANGGVPQETFQANRGWTEAEWEESRHRLVARGLLDRTSRPTRAGEELRRQLEDATDRLAADPLAALGESGVEEAIGLAVPLSRHLVDTGVLPMPNPIGVPRP
ncbi:SCO6745 family protein [Streptomyces blastmyceticus]|uniref:SalK n=1 Tax=Streptomyces blastmyceticus TaxID=68180 RepID=A0ABN0WQI3_9ACTN